MDNDRPLTVWRFFRILLIDLPMCVLVVLPIALIGFLCVWAEIGWSFGHDAYTKYLAKEYGDDY